LAISRIRLLQLVSDPMNGLNRSVTVLYWNVNLDPSKMSTGGTEIKGSSLQKDVDFPGTGEA